MSELADRQRGWREAEALLADAQAAELISFVVYINIEQHETAIGRLIFG